MAQEKFGELLDGWLLGLIERLWFEFTVAVGPEKSEVL